MRYIITKQKMGADINNDAQAINNLVGYVQNIANKSKITL